MVKQEGKIYYMHFRRFDRETFGYRPNGGVTVAYRFNKGPIKNETIGVNDTIVQWAIARCSPKDHYNKRMGRLIASGRLEHFGSRESMRMQEENWFDRFVQEISETLTVTRREAALINTSYWNPPKCEDFFERAEVFTETTFRKPTLWNAIFG